MSDYVIFTDSACDIERELLDEWGVKYCPLTFMFNNSERQYSNYDLPSKEFYAKMRSGSIAKTAAANSEVLAEMFEEELRNGRDILCVVFSSGLSTTFNCACMAAEDMGAKYPDRKILVVDSLSASAGFGLLLYLTVQQKNSGATIEQTAQFVADKRLHICHWFTVDDLVYLKRGGRISPTLAFVGGVLGIKPVLHMDDEGHLINITKVRGRKAAVKALADKFGELAVDHASPVFISHGDCIEDAETLKNMLAEKYGVKVQLIADVGPVIGAHSGPGTLALFFVGKER